MILVHHGFADGFHIGKFINLLEEKINIKDYKNKIAEYTILQSDIANSVDINFENGESIKLK